MKPIALIVFMFVSVTTLNNHVSAQPISYSGGLNTQTRLAKDTDHLFNGRNLEGWYTFIKGRGRNHDPENVFKVKDGIIYISGMEKGCITTDKEYDNYKLIVEYKWDDDSTSNSAANREGVARDCGVLLNSIGKDGAYSGIWMYSIEVNIIEGGTGDFIVVGNGTDLLSLTARVAAMKQGSSYIFEPGSDHLATIHGGRINWFGRDPEWKNIKGFRGKNDIEKPVGEWNRLECIVNGGKISVYLNGILVNQAINVKPKKGKIQIQSESSPILIRRVDLIPLALHTSAGIL
jgi:hypothetical protein